MNIVKLCKKKIFSTIVVDIEGTGTCLIADNKEYTKYFMKITIHLHTQLHVPLSVKREYYFQGCSAEGKEKPLATSEQWHFSTEIVSILDVNIACFALQQWHFPDAKVALFTEIPKNCCYLIPKTCVNTEKYENLIYTNIFVLFVFLDFFGIKRKIPKNTIHA